MKTQLQRVGDAILFGAVCAGGLSVLVCLAAVLAAGETPPDRPVTVANDLLAGGLYSLAGSAVFIVLGAVLGRKWGKR